MSAPYAARSLDSLVVPAARFIPFQALFGWDAHMASLVVQAKAVDTDIHFLAAPEISSAQSLFPPDQDGRSRTHVHLRFGSPRSPGLLKGAINIAVVTEDLSSPSECGRHPFATGTVFPKGLAAVLSDERHRVLGARRIDDTVPPAITMPTEFSGDTPEAERSPNEPAFHRRVLSIDDLTVQSCRKFTQRGAVQQAPSSQPPPRKAEGEINRAPPCTLLPWNLAHPGSLVPDLLEKAMLLRLQARCPVTVLVMPFNDSPIGLAKFEDLASTGCRQTRATLDQGKILFIRTPGYAGGVEVAASCKRAWIDATDPEWWATAQLLRRLNLAVNFVSEVPMDYKPDYDPGPLGTDEDITVHSYAYGHVAWQSRAMSIRRLAALMAAVARGEDCPFPPPAGNALPGVTDFNLVQAIWNVAEAYG